MTGTPPADGRARAFLGLAPGLLAISIAACVADNPAYCDAVTPCMDGGRPFCDESGTYRASRGVKHTCIPEPACHPGSCGLEAPVCEVEEEVCTACRDDEDCAGFDEAPRCAADGTCVGCVVNGDCESDACHPITRECLSDEQVLYLDASAEEAGDCSRGAPCPDLGDAVTRLSPGRFALRLAPGGYPSGVSTGPRTLLILADPNAILTPRSGADEMLLVEPDGDVLLQGVSLAGANGGATMVGIRCQGDSTASTTLTVVGVTVTGTPNSGVDAHNCELSVVGSRIEKSGGWGINAIDGSTDIVRSRIYENGAGGVLASGTALLFRNNFVGRNGSPAGGNLGVGLLNDLRPGSRVEHNTMVKNHGGLQCVGDSTLSNNILYGNGDGEQAIGCRVRSSLVGPVAEDGPGNLDAPPIFLDPESDADFHLDPSSPGVDQAEDSDVADDIDGEPRPQGEASDMGADEVVPEAAGRAEPAGRR